MNTDLRAYNKIAIIGAGGLGKEVLCAIGELVGWKDLSSKVTFLVEEKYFKAREVFGIQVQLLTVEHMKFDTVIIAIGDLAARIRIRNMLPGETQYATIIHPSVQLTPYTNIGEGTIVLGNVLLSCEVEIGKFAIINPGVTISHDTTIGDFFTASPGVNISGTCKIGERVFIGTGAAVRNAISIGDDVAIGMGAVVVGDILQPGTYIGNPAKLI